MEFVQGLPFPRMTARLAGPCLTIYDDEGRLAIKIEPTGVTLHPEIAFDEATVLFVERVNDLFLENAQRGGR